MIICSRHWGSTLTIIYTNQAYNKYDYIKTVKLKRLAVKECMNSHLFDPQPNLLYPTAN